MNWLTIIKLDYERKPVKDGLSRCIIKTRIIHHIYILANKLLYCINGIKTYNESNTEIQKQYISHGQGIQIKQVTSF